MCTVTDDPFDYTCLPAGRRSRSPYCTRAILGIIPIYHYIRLPTIDPMDISKRILLAFISTCLFTGIHSQTSIHFRDGEIYLSSPYQGELSLQEFTLECWLMRNGEGISVHTGRGGVEAIPIISKGVENLSRESGLNYFLGLRQEDGILVFDFESSGSAVNPYRNHPVAGYHPLENNRWYHVSATYDKKTLRIFLDGKPETEMEIGALPSFEDTSALVIGGMAGSPGQFDGEFAGKLDELRIWNYARTQQQIVENMNREIPASETGLIIRAGFNEGTGTMISCSGAIPHLNWSGSGGSWAENAPFDAELQPANEDTFLFSIGLIADPQYCDCDPDGAKIFRSALHKLPVAIDSMNKFQVDFVMNLGDMIDRNYANYDSVYQFYQDLRMPWHNVLGNHEFEEIPDSMMSSILQRNGMPDYYYGFNYKNWRFLMLDGTELAAYTRYLHPDLAGEGDSLFQEVQDKVNNRESNGGIGRDQRKWIRDQLLSAYNAKQHVILFCHFPLYPDTIYLNLWNNEEIMALIEEYPHVVAYINGHYHYGNYGFRNGIHYIDQAGMLLTQEFNSFSVLEVHTGKLVFRGYGLNPDRVLTWDNPFQTASRLGTSGLQAGNVPALYPNPVSGNLFIRLDDPVADKSLALIITDLNGRMLKIIDQYSVNHQAGIIEVKLKTGIPAGIYLIRILRPSQKDIVGKIIVSPL